MYLDNALGNSTRIDPITPPWEAFKKDIGEREKWFQTTRPQLEQISQYRIQTMVNNLLWYTGEYDKTAEYQIRTPNRPDTKVPRRIIPRIFNHLHDITEQRVAKLTRLKPSFDITPTNSQEKDRLVSRLLKTALEAVARRIHIEYLMQEVERWNAVFGEIYVGIEWNKHIGDRKSGDTYERVGDVDIYLKAPWTVLPEPKRRWCDVSWCMDIESIMPIEEARVRFNNPEMQSDGKMNIFTFNADLEEKRIDEVVVWRVTIPPSRFCPKGDIRYFCNDKEVDAMEGDYPYSHGSFPWERHTDLDIPGRLFPQSFYEQVKPVQHVYNKLTSLITRNITLVGHPHILMPKGAAKIEAFGNAATSIEFNGPVKPEIVTFSSVPQEAFQFRTGILQEMGQVSGVQGVSRGAPPAGARAASMLRFYEEQEEQRASTQIIKHNELIRAIYIKAGSVIGDYYPKGDHKRLIRVVGKENEYDVQAFAGVKVSAEYDVVIQNSTGFSESKAIRMDEIKMVDEIAPGMLSNDQKADILELKNPQKLYDVSTAAIKQAEDENERILDGKKILPPQPYQDLIAHWRTHMIMMNTSTWENTIPQDIKAELIDHMTTTERLMEEKAGVSQAFAQMLSTLTGYPSFWFPTPQPAKTTNQAQQPPAQPGMPGAGNPLAAAGAPGGNPLDAPADPAAEGTALPPMPEVANVPSALMMNAN